MLNTTIEELGFDDRYYTEKYGSPYVGRNGWICPRCGSSNSPDSFSCPNCLPQIQKPYIPPRLPERYPFLKPNITWCTKNNIEECDLPSFTVFVKDPNDPPEPPEPGNSL